MTIAAASPCSPAAALAWLEGLDKVACGDVPIIAAGVGAGRTRDPRSPQRRIIVSAAPRSLARFSDAALVLEVAPGDHRFACALIAAFCADEAMPAAAAPASQALLAMAATAGLTRQRDAVTAGLARVETQLATYRTTLTRQYAAMDRLVAASKAVGVQLDTQIRIWTNSDN